MNKKKTKDKHANCTVKAVLCNKGPHRAALRCVKHKKHIQWLSIADYQRIKLLELTG